MENKNSLEIYKEQINSDAKEKVDYLFWNKEEFRYYMKSIIFKNAKKEINIVINYDSNDIKDMNDLEYIDNMKSFLDKNGTILKIIILRCNDTEIIQPNNLFYKALFDHPAYNENRIKIKYSASKKCFRDPNENIIDFCTGDNHMFNRYNINKHYNITNFNDTKLTKQLIEIFNKIFYSNIQVEPLDLSKYFNRN